MKTSELRNTFLQFFEKKGHMIVASSSLIPNNDRTLLFTNAGMVQFKDVFLGNERRDYKAAVSSQRCVRAGGKHNDLNNVGYTARHHTFFEMLGNFSFGDYFKREAINYAWEFCTKVLLLPEERLWITVYKDDKQSEDIWLKEIGVDAARFSRCAEKDNFWSMGDTGPCGPCSEIFYDHGEHIPGGPPGSPEEDGDRYIEIWNLVFMQYNRLADGSMEDLPNPAVDTGMGIERVAAILQGKHNNYDIDIFQSLIQDIGDITQTSNLLNKSLRVIADHLRSCVFLVADGVVPSNEGRGYVLRRIMRRAIRHGNQLGQQQPFFHRLVASLVNVMGDAYPILHEKAQFIEEIFLQEEIQFNKTLATGLKIFHDSLKSIANQTIDGNLAFKLYDTYGFPVDLTQDLARENGLLVDMEGFELAMQEQQARARESNKFKNGSINIDKETLFVGYHEYSCVSKVVAIFDDNDCPIDEMQSGLSGKLVLEQTPFYAESGGQVGDSGLLSIGNDTLFEVTDTQKAGKAHIHIGHLKQGKIKKSDKVDAAINLTRRKSIELNHSATHLLHAALREILGEHVQQKGSVVDAQRLRFDFSHPHALTAEEIVKLESLVNYQIRENGKVETNLMPIEQAIANGAMALFDEKYDKNVRVLTMNNGFSIELCGGTHVSRPGDIGFFKITSESGVAAGVRRIEAITGDIAIKYQQQVAHNLSDLAEVLRTNPDNIENKVISLLEKTKVMEKQISKLQAIISKGGSEDLMAKIKEVAGVKILAAKLETGDVKFLREAVDNYKNQLKTAVVVLAISDDSKVNIIAGVTDDCIHKIKANDLVKQIASQIGGKGGGRADMAQAGGSQPENLSHAIASVYDIVAKAISLSSINS